jgi:hypothetical protein
MTKGSICGSNPKASSCLVFDPSCYYQFLVAAEERYISISNQMSEILGYAVGLRWRIGSSSFFASPEMLDTLYGGGGFGKCP